VAFLAVTALVGPASAEQELDFRTPAPGVPFVIVTPGGSQNIQVCASKKLLDQLTLWPGQPIVADLTWYPPKTQGDWPVAGGEHLPRKIKLLDGMWIDGKLCSETVYAKYQDFPVPGYWEVDLSLRAPVKKYGSDMLNVGGGKRTIRVDAVFKKPSSPGTVTTKPGGPVLPPAGQGQDSGSGSGGRSPARR
jgi:hypothetical protein